MKKLSLILTLIALSHPAFAAKLVSITTMTDPSLQAVVATAMSTQLISGATAYTVVKETPANGRSAQQARIQTLKQAMVIGVCSFFDEQINLSQDTTAESAISTLKDYENDGELDQQIGNIQASLTPIMQLPGIEVYSGGASGNNTEGAVIGIYDLNHNQIFVMGSSNCGSDD